jgi:cell cycle sensor histidine kinase DivJ
VGLFAPIHDYLAALQSDAPVAGRRGGFGALRLLGGLGMLAAIALAFIPRGVPNVLETALLAWLFAAHLQARASRDENAPVRFAAQVRSALALTGLVTTAAYATGGLTSFAAIWLVLLPMEAALSGSRRVVGLASIMGLGAAAFLLSMSTLDPLAPKLAAEPSVPAVLGVVSALLYAMGLALGAQSQARTSVRLDHAGEDRYRLLARDMTDVVTRLGRNGHALFVSPAAEPLFGAGLRALQGGGLFDRVHVADRPAYLRALSDAATLRESRTVELRIRRDSIAPGSTGAFIWIEMRCWPLDGAAQPDAGAEGEVVAVMRDVTARKDEEHAIEDARAEAEQANVAKSRFLATMSHELRTPLNAIIGFSEMLREEGALMIDAKQRRDYAHLINESGHHLLSVVNGILDMSKIESGNFEIMPEPVATERVIAECCELLALRARQAGIDIVVQRADELPAIVADRRALLQIMLNLMSNAIRFTNRGGRVTVTSAVEAGHKAGVDCGVETGHETAHMIITVADTGVGIGAEDLPRVGEPFFQARSSYDRRHDGTGLGVSIVKGLLDLHGGWMEIESRVSEGTRVIVHLPFDCDGGRRNSEAPARIVPRINDVRPDIVVKKSA